jgi:hypothetical protein
MGVLWVANAGLGTMLYDMDDLVADRCRCTMYQVTDAAMRPRPTRPPMTPPAIAPALEDFCLSWLCEGDAAAVLEDAPVDSDAPAED